MRKIIMLLVLLLILIGCSQPKQQQTSNTPTQETKIETKPQVTESTSNVPSNWKTYQGLGVKGVEGNKFEIKYPPELEMTVETAEVGSDIFYLENTKGSMIVGLYSFSSELYTKDTLIKILRKSNELKVISEKTITINGLDVTYFIAEVPGIKPPKQNQVYYAYIASTDNRITFQISGPDLETTLTLDQFIQILSTFKFLN